MKTYLVYLHGENPLIMHNDNIEWADFMEEWKNNPENKKVSKAGDDRTPAWRWMGCLYHDGKQIAVPQQNIMRAIMEGGALVPIPGGKNGKTFKSQTQSGMMSVEPFWSLTIRGNPILWNDIEGIKDEPSFAQHQEFCKIMGFELFVKRAKIGMSKHIRVRPLFPANWTLTGHLVVWDEQITEAALTQILEFTGRYKGLGDWRPGGKTPGPYGTFTATVKAV